MQKTPKQRLQTVSIVPRSKLIPRITFHFARALQTWLEEMFENAETKKRRKVPEAYSKPDYYARKTCNYFTAVLKVEISVAKTIEGFMNCEGLLLLPSGGQDCSAEGLAHQEVHCKHSRRSRV